jgi:Xaa-Pro aminopeptidase
MKPQEEILEKKRRVRDLMDRLNLSAVLFRKQCNFSWLTGGGLNLIGIATEMGVASLLITRGKDYVLCNHIEAPRMKNEEGLPGQGYEIVSYDWFDEKEGENLKRLVPAGTIGCDSAFPGTVDVSKDINPLRYSLLPPEIDRYRTVGHLTAKAIEETAMTVKPGDKECEIIGRLTEHLWKDRLDYITLLCAADERASLYRHPIPTEKKVDKYVMICVNARKWGLIVSLTRFVYFGKAPRELLDKYQATVYVDSVLMANTVPGKPAKDAFLKGLDAYKEVGYPEEYKLHHQGGSIGYVGRDYKVNFTTTDIVQPNQGFTWNPSITGTKSEDTILATAAGPDILSKPVYFPVLEMSVGGFNFKRPAILER